MPRLRALMSWSGRKRGDEWDATDEEARILTVDLPGGRRAEFVETRVMNTDDESALVPQRGRYNRRDQRARE